MRISDWSSDVCSSDLLDPQLVVRKFLAFGRLDAASRKAEEFVALEDWLNDGVPLAAPVARECLGRWYGDNATARGQWRPAGCQVDPTQSTLPTLCVIPAQERIGERKRGGKGKRGEESVSTGGGR